MPLRARHAVTVKSHLYSTRCIHVDLPTFGIKHGAHTFCLSYFLSHPLHAVLPLCFARTFTDLHSPQDKYHMEYFERFALGNKPYYSAGMGLGAAEHTSRVLLQVHFTAKKLSIQIPPLRLSLAENLNIGF